MNQAHMAEPVAELADDVCSLPLVRRMAALLNHDTQRYRVGDPLPRGWHVMLCNPPTAQDLLRADGAAGLGFMMPDVGMPRLMLGGRKIDFLADIPIGAAVMRRSTLAPVTMKEGRSGAFALLEVEHEISVRDSGQTAVVEVINYILRPEEDRTARVPSDSSSAKANAPVRLPDSAVTRIFRPDETMLFRYSAITDNPHRIHYDYPYTTQSEGYPALVVNGSLPQMVLLDMFRSTAGREPLHYVSRSKAPIFCGAPVTLSVVKHDDRYVLMAQTEDGNIAIEAEAW